MQPSELKANDFDRYPPKARELAVKNLATLQRIPLVLTPILLREVIDHDWHFPTEQRALIHQFSYLQSLSGPSFDALMAPFAAIHLPPQLDSIDWVNRPQRFSEQLSTALWSMQKMDDYREAAKLYQKHLEEALPEKAPDLPRFTIVVIGRGVPQTTVTLFRPLRPQGTLFTSVQPAHGLETLIQFVNKRASAHPQDYAHWYIDGGVPHPDCGPQQRVTRSAYGGVASAALKELNLITEFAEQAEQKNAANAESVQSFIAALSPEDLVLRGNSGDAALRHFEVKVLTEGAATQVFSTTFVQWAAREALRRARPLTLLARFAPRQKMVSMNELLKRDPLTQVTDPEGSLIDADMGAYYTWINQSRLSGSEDARFLVWYEEHSAAVAIAPAMARASTSDTPASLDEILRWMG